MTATLPEVETPSFTDSQLYTAAEHGLRRIAELEINEQITETDATQRVAWYMARHGIHLTPENRNDAWEILKDGIQRLTCLETPGGCGCHDHRPDEIDDLILWADHDIRTSTKKLIGERPAAARRA